MQIASRALISSKRGESIHSSGVGPGLTALCRGIIDSDGAPVADLAERLRAADRLGQLGAPFAAALVEERSATIAADHVGFRHVYGAQKADWAAVCTSARELADLTGAGLDHAALSVFRLTGHYLDDETAYSGVPKLAPGHLFQLSDGRLRAGRYPQKETVTTDDPAAAHARRLRELVAGFLEHHHGAMLELSGGLDSRMVLAAVPRPLRKSLTAFTIVNADSNDGSVAAALARRYGMSFRPIDIGGLAELDPEAAFVLARAAAWRLDGLGRPLSAAAFQWVEAQVEQAPRLSGHGGEMARALFGPGVEFERPHTTVKPEVVKSYIRRWIISNDAVPDEVLTPEFASESRLMAMKRLWEAFDRPDTDWLGSLSEFYLRQRMHRFGGMTITDGCHSRLTLNPLSDSDVLALAGAVPPKLRAGSRYAVRVLDRLDPELARIPLGSGLRPMVLNRPITLTRRLGENTVRGFLRKATNKVVRTLNSQRRAAAGAPLLSVLVVSHWRDKPELLAPVLRTGLVSESYMDRMLRGEVEPDSTAVDFLLNLGVIAATGAER
ncbi:MAG TPA: asparagine synthase-related protein [Candidatus Limnocylindrales bacterium]